MKAGPVQRLTHVALGVVALALFGASVWLTWTFLHGGLQSGEPASAFFSAPGVGQQLPTKGDVKVRGVLVGRISDIRLDGDEARIDMMLDDGLELPGPVSAEIRSKTIFGQKWVELIPGDGAVVAVGAGTLIPDERTIEPLELERALQLGHELLSEVPMAELAETFSALADGFSGSEPDARKAMDRGLVALKAVNSRSDRFDLSLRQLREFSAWVDENDDALLSFLSSLESSNRALVGAAPEFRSNLQSNPIFWRDLADFFEQVNPDLGRLVDDGATLTELLAARSDDINALIVNLRPFTTVWNSGLKQPCGGLYEEDLTCWQIYQPPGLESRGLYGNSPGPDADEPGDPNYGKTNRRTTDPAADDLERLLSSALLETSP